MRAPNLLSIGMVERERRCMIFRFSDAPSYKNASNNSDICALSPDNLDQATNILLDSCDLVASQYEDQLRARVTTELNSATPPITFSASSFINRFSHFCPDFSLSNPQRNFVDHRYQNRNDTTIVYTKTPRLAPLSGLLM